MGRDVSDILRANGINGVDVDEDSLAHYGKKGMRWGQRKQRKNERQQGNHERAAARAKTKEMSNDELKAAIDRLKLEREYKQLNAHEISAGQKLVMEVLRDVGKQTAKSYVTGAIQELTKKEPDDGAKIVKQALKAAPKVAPGPMKLEFAKRF
jgi:hypothetical protein